MGFVTGALPEKGCPMNRFACLAVVSLAVFAGCSKDDESAAKRAGAKVGETLTDFATGVGKGIDKKMMVNVELSKDLTEQGISMTIAKAEGIDPAKAPGEHASTIRVYLIASKPFRATLGAKALTKEGQEIGRSVAEVELAADEAKYVSFVFDEEMDTQLVAKYAIDIKK